MEGSLLKVDDFILKNWGEESIINIANTLDMNIDELIKLALKLGLSDTTTPDIGRSWTEKEDSFLVDYSNILSIRQASNLLYRSHYATYQRVRLLGLNEMINKR